MEEFFFETQLPAHHLLCLPHSPGCLSSLLWFPERGSRTRPAPEGSGRSLQSRGIPFSPGGSAEFPVLPLSRAFPCRCPCFPGEGSRAPLSSGGSAEPLGQRGRKQSKIWRARGGTFVIPPNEGTEIPAGGKVEFPAAQWSCWCWVGAVGWLWGRQSRVRCIQALRITLLLFQGSPLQPVRSVSIHNAADSFGIWGELASPR